MERTYLWDNVSINNSETLHRIVRKTRHSRPCFNCHRNSKKQTGFHAEHYRQYQAFNRFQFSGFLKTQLRKPEIFIDNYNDRLKISPDAWQLPQYDNEVLLGILLANEK